MNWIFASFSSITSVFAILLLLLNQKACFFVHDQGRNCKHSLFLLILMRVKFFSTICSFNEPGPICVEYGTISK